MMVTNNCRSPQIANFLGSILSLIQIFPVSNLSLTDLFPHLISSQYLQVCQKKCIISYGIYSSFKAEYFWMQAQIKIKVNHNFWILIGRSNSNCQIRESRMINFFFWFIQNSWSSKHHYKAGKWLSVIVYKHMLL